MFVVGNFLIAVGNILDMLLTFYMFVIIIDALLSWVSPDPYNPVVRILHQLTEPVLRPIRRLLPFGVGIDFSPILAILAISFLRAFLIQTLLDIGYQMKM